MNEKLSKIESENEIRESYVTGNFTFDAEMQPDEQDPEDLHITELVFKDNEGHEKNITEDLPQGWRFVLTDKELAMANQLDRIIFLPKFYLTDKHEQYPPEKALPKPTQTTATTLLGDTWLVRKVRPKTRTVFEYQKLPVFNNPNFLATFYHELGHVEHPNNQSLSNDYQERERQLLLATERRDQIRIRKEEQDCWEFVINKLLALEESGFRFEHILSESALNDCIDWPLTSYGMTDEEITRFYYELIAKVKGHRSRND